MDDLSMHAMRDSSNGRNDKGKENVSGTQDHSGNSRFSMGVGDCEAYMAGPYVDENTVKVMLSEPNNGWVHSTCHDNRIDVYMHLARKEFEGKYKFFTGNASRLMIQFAREMICEHALKANMDYILFIDDDMIVPNNIFDELIKYDADIVAPLMHTRRWPYEPVIYKMTELGMDGDTKNLRSQSVTDFTPGDVVECDSVGFGVVLLKVEALKKIQRPWFFVNQPIGEDIWFCMKAKEQIPDFKILVNTAIQVGHMKSDPDVIWHQDFLDVKDTDKYKKLKADQEAKMEEEKKRFEIKPLDMVEAHG